MIVTNTWTISLDFPFFCFSLFNDQHGNRHYSEKNVSELNQPCADEIVAASKNIEFAKKITREQDIFVMEGVLHEPLNHSAEIQEAYLGRITEFLKEL